MKNTEWSAKKLELEKILRRATPIILEGYSATPGSDRSRATLLGIEQKSSYKDIVTIFDKKVEAFLHQEFEKSFPGEVRLGEEDMAARKASSRELGEKLNAFWVIDPIDGTTNYSRAYPFFCTTAAYVVKDGSGYKPVIGATWDPLRQEMFSAVEGEGAWLNNVRLSVTQIENPQEALCTTGFASARVGSGEKGFELFKKLTQLTLGVRRDGSAALDLAYVAAGRIDAYWEWGLSPWDIATGMLLVREAGGKISHHDGKAIDLFSGEILSSNGILHKWLVDRIKE